MQNTHQLTFTRFIAAIAIVIFHFGNQTSPFNNSLLYPIISQSNLGVSYFFILSGFVMVLAYGHQTKVNVKHYLINRAARILPLYYLALGLMLFYFFIRLVVLKMEFIYQPNFLDTVLNITLLQSWIPFKAQTINTAAWSLSVEALFYFSFPLLLNYIFPKRKIRFLLISAIVFFVLSQSIYHYLLFYTSINKVNLYYHPLLHFNEFLLGISLGFIFIKSSQLKANFTLPILCLSTITILICLYFPINKLDYHNGLMAIAFIPFIYFLAKDNSRISIIFRNPALIYLGEISYGIYILQFPIFYFFTATLTFIGIEYEHVYFYPYLIILVIISAISYNWIEKPLRTKIKSWAV